MEEISSVGKMSKLMVKRQASMEEAAPIKEVQSTRELARLEEMRSEIDYAFSLMGEVRGRLEEAYAQLNPSK